MEDQAYYNAIAGGLVVGVLVIFAGWAAVGIGAGSGGGVDAGGAAAPVAMHLSIVINPVNGMPQYSPANFTVPEGQVVFTIQDFDAATSWDGCTCNVTGTVGGTESINGTATSVVPTSNAAHTFTIAALGVNVVSPGNSTVTFTLDLTGPGSYTWECMAPCGADGATGVPMGDSGYMTGTMTVE